MLVNNASTFYPTPFGSITPAQWADLSGTNLQAPLFLAQAAAPALRRARGLIVNIVDIHGLRPLRNYLRVFGRQGRPHHADARAGARAGAAKCA